MAGCAGMGSSSGAPLGSIGHVTGFIGGVATEGPRATLIARNMLSAGGTAADAAIAAALMLTVTYPISASLAGGGRCLVFDGERERVEYLDFPARPPASGGTVPVPGLVRGLALLHAGHGRLAWSQLVSPAEQVARFGERVSRAYARALQTPGAAARLSAPARSALAVGPEGQLLDEAAPHAQPELASALSRIRIAGAGDFYSGLLARNFVEAVGPLGGRITMADMRDYRIVTGQPESRPFDAFEVYFDGTGTAGLLATWDKAVDRRVALLDDTANLAALPSALLSTPMAARPVPGALDPAAGPGATTIAVVDRQGQAVACSLEVGAPFGSGLYAQSVGMLLAAMPDPAGNDRAGTSLAVVGSPKSWRARGAFGVAAMPAGAAAAVLLETLLPMLADNVTAAQAQARPRFAVAPGGTAMLVEPQATASGDLSPDLRQALAATGRPLVVTEKIGRANIAYCATGIPVDDAEECYFAHDPRGFGLGAGHGF